MGDAEATMSSGGWGASSPLTLCLESRIALGNRNSPEALHILSLALWLPHLHPSSVPSPSRRASQCPSVSLPLELSSVLSSISVIISRSRASERGKKSTFSELRFCRTLCALLPKKPGPGSKACTRVWLSATPSRQLWAH